MAAGSSSQTTGTIPEPCSTISVTRTFSTRFDTASLRRTGSTISGAKPSHHVVKKSRTAPSGALFISGAPMARSSPAKMAARLLADRRGVWSKRFHLLLDQHLAEFADPTPAQASLCRRCTVLEIGLEAIEAKMAAGDDDPALLDLYARASGQLGRLLRLLGVERKPKTISTTLGDVWRAEHAELMAAATAEREAREAAAENQEQPEEQS